MTEVAVVKFACPLETTNVAVAELLVQYEEMAVAELLVDQKEWQVLVPQVMTLVCLLNCIRCFYGDIGPSKKISRQFHNMN
jgi:hypothetical protein